MVAKLPPRPPAGSWITGHLGNFSRDRLGFMLRCARDYGDMTAIRLAHHRVYLANHPQFIEEVLVDKSRHFIKHFALRLTPMILGKGLLTSEADFWLRQRRLIQPAFVRSRLAAYGPPMVAAAERVLDEWSPGETRDIAVEMSRITLDIAAKALFDADGHDSANEVRDALQYMLDCFLVRFSRFLLPIPSWVPTPRNLQMRRAVRRLDDVIYGYIRRRRQCGEDKGDLLSILLHARDEDDGKRMSDRQVRDEAMTLFLAGHETTALVLSWTWFLLATNPQAEQRLMAELKQVLNGQTPTVADLPRLRYTEAVINESMRLRPPVYAFGREALDDCEIGGFHVPRKTTILMSQWVVQRDPRWFPEPEKFLPERWLDERAQQVPKYAYFPFGVGPRMCIGNTFAMMETVLVLATIAQRFCFTIADGHEVVPQATFTLRPLHGIPAVITPRRRTEQPAVVSILPLPKAS
jgi:cytochrome P450